MVLDNDNYVLSNTSNSYYLLMTTSRNTYDNVIIWHARLGHIGQEIINRLVKEYLLSQFTKIDISTCEYCLVGKIIRKPFEKGTRVETTLQLIHFGICGLMSVRARHHILYFITLQLSHIFIGHIGQAINLKLKGMNSKGGFFLGYIDKNVFIID